MNKLMTELPKAGSHLYNHPESETLNKFIEGENSFKIKLSLAGAPKESIKASFCEDMVTVTAKADDGVDYHYRCHIAAKKINPKKTKAKYENGILELDVPKAEKVEPISIKIV